MPRATLERLAVLGMEMRRRQPWRPLPGPQTMVLESQADIIGFGGSAGGGKTDLIVGLCTCHHQRALVLRKEKAQTEGIIQRMAEVVRNRDGFNSQKSIWVLPVGKQCLVEFGGLDNEGDEQRWQGRPHDLKAYDEVTEQREAQVRFTMGWNRSADPKQRLRVVMTFNPPTTPEGRWVIRFFAPWLDSKHRNPAQPGELRWFTTKGENQDYEVPDGRAFVWDEDGRMVYDFNPNQYKPEQIIRPKSRTFIPARVTDNPYYMASGYMSTLQALPEPLRSQMLYGDFKAGIKDNAMQVIPTKWAEAAQARWVDLMPKPVMDSMGVDVARGGDDKTVIGRRHGVWFDRLVVHDGSSTPNGPITSSLVLADRRDRAPIHVDAIGVGASVYDFLVLSEVQVHPIIASEEAAGKTDKSGALTFANVKSWMWWQLREALDPANNTGIMLPPDPILLQELTTPMWRVVGRRIMVESREDIIKKLGRSVDRASAVLLANLRTPKRAEAASNLARASGKDPSGADYDPYK